MTEAAASRFTVRMSNDRANEDIHDPADLAARQRQEAERAQAEKIAGDNTAAGDTGDTHGTTVAGGHDGVEGTDPDLSVPGESDTAGSGGQGADEKYRDGELGGGAIGGTVDDGKETR